MELIVIVTVAFILLLALGMLIPFIAFILTTELGIISAIALLIVIAFLLQQKPPKAKSFQNLRNVDIYNWMMLVLAVLTGLGLYAFYAADFASAAPTALAQVAASVVIAFVLDSVIIYAKEKAFRFSKSAIISGFFVGTVMAPQASIVLPIAAVTIAILQKHILRFGGRPLFNPASFGLVAAGLLLAADHGWWAAAMLPAVVILGLFVVVLFGRLHLAVPYLVAYWVLSAALIIAAGGNIALIGSRILDGTMLFFAFLMLIEPRTAPSVRKGRIIYGIIAGVLAAVLFAINAPYFIPLNLLVANLFTRPLEKWLKPRAKALPAGDKTEGHAQARA
jgi:Na+-translocating ferredoxin:NAD+ oxidoreductase RnfD subunit